MSTAADGRGGVIATAAWCFIGVAWVLSLFLGFGIRLDHDVPWGNSVMVGEVFAGVLMVSATTLLAGGVMILLNRRLGWITLQVLGLAGSVGDFVGRIIGDGSGPVPSFYWWVLLLAPGIVAPEMIWGKDWSRGLDNHSPPGGSNDPSPGDS